MNDWSEFTQSNLLRGLLYSTWKTAIMQKLYDLEKGPWSYADMKLRFLSIYKMGFMAPQNTTVCLSIIYIYVCNYTCTYVIVEKQYTTYY